MFCNFLIILWANASKYGSLRYGKVLYILYAPTPARSTMESQPYGLTTGSAGGLDEPLRGIFRFRL